MRSRREQKAPTTKSAGKWKLRAGLWLIALAAYSNSFGLGFVQDSVPIVTQDARVREVTAANIKLILEKGYWWPKHADHLYRPVTTASFLVNYAVLGNGANPAGYHWVNFLLHVANAWLVFEIALLLLPGAAPAFFAAALWAVHPIGVESVVNIVGRADLLAAASVLAGLWLYARMSDPAGWRLPLSLFAISTIGVFSKESAAVLIGLMLLWDLSFRPGGMSRRLSAYAAASASLGVLWVVRRSVFDALPWPQTVYVDNMMQAADFWTARLTAIKVIGLDLSLLLFPFPLASDRSYNAIPISGAADPAAWLSLAVVTAILAAAVIKRKQYPLLFFAAGFFGLTLLPASNLIVLIKSVMAERFLYLPSAGFALATAALAYRLKERQAAIALAGLVLLYAGRTFARTLDWKDNLTLASADVGRAPDSFRLHDTIAKSLFQQDAERHIDRIIREQETAWSIVAALPPERSSELIPANLGIYYATKAASLGSPAQSRPWFEKSVAVLLRAKKISRVSEKAFDEAQRTRGKPLTSRTAFPLLYFYLANAYLHLGRHAEAVEALRDGQDIDPGFLDAYDSLAGAHLQAGNAGEAAVAMLEKGFLDGFSQATIAALQAVYQKIPDGSCAASAQGLNWTCPRLRSDLCIASAALARSFDAARDAQAAAAVKDTANRRYGCAAAPR